MKTLGNLIFAGLALALATSCMDTHTLEVDMNVPVYMDFETMRASLKTSSARELKNPGKICFKDNYLFIVENREGIHVIDVSNPADPRNVTFLEVAGCYDIAVRNKSLYAEHQVDLVVLDISNINNVKETGRIKDVFTPKYPEPKNPNLACDYVDNTKGIVIDWEIKRVKTEKVDGGYWYDNGGNMTEPPMLSPGGTDGAEVGGGSSAGKNGSMARFGIYNHYLYLMSDYQLKALDLDAPEPTAKVVESIGNFETMFIHDDHLFFGAPSGMFIYSLELPMRPMFVLSYSHVTSCDPVVVQDSIAYITMRGGTTCRGNANQLDVVKLSDNYRKSELLDSYPMIQPYGLGVDGNLLFVCDGSEGLKVYKLDETKLPESRSPFAQFPYINAYDVIPAGNYLFMTGSDGFYLYDYTNPSDIKQIGHIPVAKKE